MADNNNYDYPTDTPMVDQGGIVTAPWGQWFSRTHRAVMSSQTSGTTAQRPTTVLWVGRRYFDETLGKPVFVKQVKPSIIWVDGVGTVS